MSENKKNCKDLFSERLNHALDINGIPTKGRGRQLVVAKMFNVSQKGASKWLEGQAFPEQERLIAIAERLKVNVEWLLTGKGFINIEDIPMPSKSVMKRIPLLEWNDAANWRKISFDQNIKWSWADADIGPCAFALKICDDSMSPRYESGAIIVVDPEFMPKHRIIVIVRIKKTNEILCRQLVVHNNKYYLKPNNVKYPALFVTDMQQIEIIGSLRQVFMTL